MDVEIREDSVIYELHKNKKGHYVYKYVYNGEIIYIGINNTNLIDRLDQHGKCGDNIRKEAWDELNASEIYYIKLLNQVMTDVVESELIRRYKPKYNIDKKNSDWNGLPFVEPEWIKYEKPVKKIKQVKEKKPRKEESFNFYETNKSVLKLLVYIFEQLKKRNFYLYHTYENNYKYPKYMWNYVDMYIDAPDWHDDEICIKFHDENRYGMYCVLSTIVEHRNGKKELVIDINDAPVFNAYECIDRFKEKIKKDFPEIFDLLSTMQEFKQNWKEFIDGCSDLCVESLPNPGKKIKIEHDAISRRNNNYFWKWYIGCKLIYSDGCCIRIYKNGKWSKPIGYYDKMYTEFREKYLEDKFYFLEEYTDYYLSHWIEEDNIIRIAPGVVRCGDFIGYFEEEMTANSMGYDIENGISLIKENNIKVGEGRDWRNNG